MSGLFGSLSSGVRALTAQSRAVETAGRNLANVNNPHYARQRVVLGDRGTVFTPEGAQSLGLEALQIQQLRDVLLDRQTVREVAATAALDTEAAAYERAQAGLGQQIGRTGDAVALGAAGSGNGLAESITAFFNAFQAFAARPTDLGERQSLVQQASALVDRVRTTDQRLEQVQTDLTEQIGTDVEEANRLLETIADLNRQIGRAEIKQREFIFKIIGSAASNLRECRRQCGVVGFAQEGGNSDDGGNFYFQGLPSLVLWHKVQSGIKKPPTCVGGLLVMHRFANIN